MTLAQSPFEGTTPVASLAQAQGVVTLVEGRTFCVSDRFGDMQPDRPEGLFLLDTRVVSRWELQVDGHPVEPLAVSLSEPYSATFVGRSCPRSGHADADVVVFRHRHVGRGMRERIEITNHGLKVQAVDIELRCESDGANLFDVKESRVQPAGTHSLEAEGGTLRFGNRSDRGTTEVTVTCSDPTSVEPGVARWRAELLPGETRTICLEVRVTLGDLVVDPLFTCAGPDEVAAPVQRLAQWRARLPAVDTDDLELAAALHRSGEDLGALRIFDPDRPDTPILAAGAPWFMTVFGRDSLLTAWMTLIADSSLAHGVLETLAAFQGRHDVAETEEEPGKILHEMRSGAASRLSLGGSDVYYGSIDATPLFVMLLGELRRWDPRDELVEKLLPHADRAMEWIANYGDRDGDGYVEYERRSPRGLANQGWKDSWDAIRFADGTLAEPPIALCEVQGYVYAAYVARAHFAEEAGDAAGLAMWAERARALKERFNRDFWLEDKGWYALGLDAQKRPIDALTSNMGHCLWTGIIEPERADAVAHHLLSPQLFSGWGIRTLATSMNAYNPVSYHNGSVWPHDNAICAAGLARYGYVDEANRVIRAQLDAAAAHGGRLPELFAGFDRGQLPTPASYPASCSPQAWAAAAPLLWLRTILRLDPWASASQLWVHPTLPSGIRRLRVSGIRVGSHQLTLTVDEAGAKVQGEGDLGVIRRPRPPLSATLSPAALVADLD